MNQSTVLEKWRKVIEPRKEESCHDKLRALEEYISPENLQRLKYSDIDTLSRMVNLVWAQKTGYLVARRNKASMENIVMLVFQQLMSGETDLRFRIGFDMYQIDLTLSKAELKSCMDKLYSGELKPL